MDKNEYTEEEVLETETSTEPQEEQIDYKELYLSEKGRRERAESKIEKIKSQTIEPAQEPKSEPKEVKNTTTSNMLSAEDILALNNAKIDEEELNIVKEYASFKQVSLREALNSSIVKQEIAQAREFKKTKEVLSTDNKRAGASKLSDEQLLSKAATSENLSAEDLKRLAWL